LPARVESHRRQYVKDIINEALGEILSYSNEWSFLYKTAELLSIADENNYALPCDYASLINVMYGDGDGSDTPLTIFNPAKIRRYTHLESVKAVSIFSLSESPYGRAGYVYPTWGLKEIAGVATSFDEEVVGRFFKTLMDGELYRIAEYTDVTHINLAQEYGGRMQAGRVNVYGDTDDEKKVVYGNIHTTNFQEWMIGKYIQIEGNGNTTFTIETVDEERQKLTVDSASEAGEDLVFSIQDDYQIDPPGYSILRLFGTPDEDNKQITVDYYASHLPLTGPLDVPLIPQRFHHVLVSAAIETYLSENPVEGVTLDNARMRKDAGIQKMLLFEDTIADATHESVEPDYVRLGRSSLVR
jgi:hypothetical protein